MKMNVAQSFAIEHSIADVLLQCLSKNLNPNECAFHLERRSIDLFQHRPQATKGAISPVILEAITTFAAAYSALKPRALSSLLVLSASSVASWDFVATSKVFELHPDLYELLARSMAGANACFEYLAPEVSKAISVAFIELSDFDTHERRGRLRRYPLTPVAVAVGGFFRKRIGENEFDSFPPELLSDVLRSLPLQALEAIPDDDWAKALDLALESKVNVEFVQVRTLVGISRGSPARGEMLRIIRKHPESSIALEVGGSESIASPQASLSSMEKIFSSLSEINTAEKAFRLTKRSCAEDDENIVQNAAAKWLSDGDMHLVAAAYVAAPNTLNRLVDNKNAVFTAMTELPPVLWSSIDEIVDDNLADLLSTISEFAHLLARRNCDNGKSAQLSLKRLALIHPFVVARRLGCLSSVCRTVLHGLTNREERYERPSLRILEVLFEVIGTLPVDCIQTRESENLCVEALEFLLEENRVENGVPDMFSDLATAVFKVLSPLQGILQDSRIPDLIAKVRKGAGTSMRIKEAAESLLPVLRAG